MQGLSDQRLRIGFLIHDVSRLRRTLYDQSLKPFGLTRSQWWVLANLATQKSDGLMQVELARSLDLGKVTLGGLLDRLENGGFINRLADPNDRRSKRVIISNQGKDVLMAIQGISHEINAQIMEQISPDDEQKLEDIMAIMKSNLLNIAPPQQHTNNKQ